MWLIPKVTYLMLLATDHFEDLSSGRKVASPMDVLRGIRIRRGFLVFLTTLIATACTDASAPTSTGVDARSDAADGASSAISPVRRPADGAPDEISRQRAWELADVWIETLGPRLAETWEEERGSEIDWSQLKRCGPTRYVASPLEAPPKAVPLSVRRYVGPWWLVNYCATGEAQMNVAVSAWNTDLTIEDGQLQFPSRAGNHFVIDPIPQSAKFKDTRLLSPSRAKQLARTVTERRPAGRPELVAQPFVKPQFAHWRIRMPEPTRLELKDEGQVVERSQVFVGSHRPASPGGVAVADNAAHSLDVRYYEKPNARRSTVVRARPGYPLAKKAVSGTAELPKKGGPSQ